MLSSFLYTSVETGSKCWSSSYVANELAENAMEYKMLCAGKAAQICGRTGASIVYKGALPVLTTSSTSPLTPTSSTTIENEFVGDGYVDITNCYVASCGVRLLSPMHLTLRSYLPTPLLFPRYFSPPFPSFDSSNILDRYR